MGLEELNSKNTAILVLDFQNDLCSKDGEIPKKLKFNVTSIHEIIPKIKKFVDSARKKGVQIIFTKQIEIPEGAPTNIQTLFKRRKLIPNSAPNSWGSSFYELIPSKEDKIIEKRTWDAFTNPELSTILKSEKIKYLIILGVLTSICIDSTARRAFSEGYEVIIPKDLVADYEHRKQLHRLTLEFFDNFLAQVVDSEKILEYL